MKLTQWQQRLADALGLSENDLVGYSKHGRQRVRPKGWKTRKRELTKQRRVQSVKGGQRRYTRVPKGHRGRRNAYSCRSWR